jgi:hypothetical protein
MVSRCLVAVLDWSLPEIFWTVFHGRRSRSALCGVPHNFLYAVKGGPLRVPPRGHTPGAPGVWPLRADPPDVPPFFQVEALTP